MTLELTLDEILIIKQALIYAQPAITAINEIPVAEIETLSSKFDSHLAPAVPILYDVDYAYDFFHPRR